MALVVRILGKAEYGKLGMIQSTVNMLGVFAGFGLSLTATKYVAELRESNPKRAGGIIGLSNLISLMLALLFAILLALFARHIATAYLNAPSLTPALRASSLMLLFITLVGAQNGIISGFEAFKEYAFIRFIAGALYFPAILCGALWQGVLGVIWGFAFVYCINWTLNKIVIDRRSKASSVKIYLDSFRSELPVLWKFSLPAVCGGALVGPVTWMCNAMLVNKPDGYAEMAIYTASLVFQQLLTLVSQTLNAPLLSIMSSKEGVGNAKLEAVNILMTWGISLLVVIPLIALPEIGELLFGSKLEGFSFRATFAIILFVASIMTYRSGLIRSLQSKSIVWMSFLNNVVWASILLGAASFCVRWGAVGLAISYAAAYIIAAAAFFPVFFRIAKMPIVLLFSKETAIIWSTLLLLVVAVLLKVRLTFRFIALPVAFAATGWSLRSLWNECKSLKHDAGNI
jgi:O-antigen/teichoic acid export membrane protein